MEGSREQLVNHHKTESAESESGHVTGGEPGATKGGGIGVKEDGAAMASSSSFSNKGNRTTSSGAGGEIQLPAKQALAVLSNVSEILTFIVYFDDILSCY
jgi:hypothetical protein